MLKATHGFLTVIGVICLIIVESYSFVIALNSPNPVLALILTILLQGVAQIYWFFIGVQEVGWMNLYSLFCYALIAIYILRFVSGMLAVNKITQE
jgi:hypothetical protein